MDYLMDKTRNLGYPLIQSYTGLTVVVVRIKGAIAVQELNKQVVICITLKFDTTYGHYKCLPMPFGLPNATNKIYWNQPKSIINIWNLQNSRYCAVTCVNNSKLVNRNDATQLLLNLY